MLAPYHPFIVHFAIALLAVGVLFRLVSLTGRMRFTGPAATTLLIFGTAAAVAAVQSGKDAHGPVERVPGSRDLVVEHEEYGEMTRNVFLGVVAIELKVDALVAAGLTDSARVLVQTLAAEFPTNQRVSEKAAQLSR